MNREMHIFTCCFCVYKARIYNRILKHYEYVHARVSDFRVICGIGGCQRPYTSIRCLKRHINKIHAQFAKVHLTYMEGDVNLEYLQTTNEASDIQREDNHEANQCNDVQLLNFDYSKRLSNVLLHLRDKLKVGQAAISFVSDEIANLLTVNNEQFAVRIQRALTEANDLSEVDIEMALRQQNHASAGACKSVSNSRHLDQYVIKNFRYVAPVQQILGHSNGKAQTMQYVSILETLKSLLMHEDIIAEIFNERQATDGNLRDYCDGKFFRKNPLFQFDKKCLQVQLYCDEFTLTNPYRDRGKNYKLFAVYFQLGNLRPKYRSTLDNINLVLLCKSVYLKQYGYEVVMRPCIRDIQILESTGIDIQIDGTHYKFKGTVSFVAADNLGAHGIGGLYENFSTVLRLCRFCNATKPMLSDFNENAFQHRTCDSWANQAEAVTNDSTLGQVYGIKCKSALDQLQYFKVAEGLPSDIAHDLLEGIVPQVIHSVLLHSVQERHLTFSQLSDAGENFKYARTDVSDKVPKLGVTASTFKVKFTQAQTWCFARFLPLMVGDKVPRDDRKWILFLQLFDVLDAIFLHPFLMLMCSMLEVFWKTSMKTWLSHFQNVMLHLSNTILCIMELILKILGH